MESETFRTRLARLIQKSRKAIRLYSSMGRSENGEFADMHLAEWREVNSDLLKQLKDIQELVPAKKMVCEIFSVRDRFYNQWRSSEAEMRQDQKALAHAAERSDFTSAFTLSKGLIVLKARVEASQAAYSEIQNLINQSKLSAPAGYRELEGDTGQSAPRPALQKSNVIPLRRRAGISLK